METKTITFIATFTGGSGTITFSGVDGLDLDKTLICDPDNPKSPQSFTADQSLGPQDIEVGGTAPYGGKIKVEIKDGNTSLTNGEYQGLFADQDLDYTVKSVY